MFLPTQASFPAVPDPSSVKVIDVSDATSAAVVLTEFDVAAAEVPLAFLAVIANV